MSGHYELADCTGTLLREVAMPEMKRRDVAKTYALAMRSSEATDWSAVNRAIIARWSVSALNWIKEQAHSGRCWGPVKLPTRRLTIRELERVEDGETVTLTKEGR